MADSQGSFNLALRLPKGNRGSVSLTHKRLFLNDISLAFSYQSGKRIKESAFKSAVSAQIKSIRSLISEFTQSAGKPQHELIMLVNRYYLLVNDNLQTVKNLIAPKKQLEIEFNAQNSSRLFVIITIQEILVEGINYVIIRYTTGRPMDNTIENLLDLSTKLSSWVDVEDELVNTWLKTTVR